MPSRIDCHHQGPQALVVAAVASHGASLVAHLRTQAADGLPLVEGRDPSGMAVVASYPGAGSGGAAREIMARI